MNTQITQNRPKLITKNTNDLLIFLTKAFLGSLLIMVSAQIAIPAWPVPMTLQTTAIMAIGLMASPGVAVSSVVMYILEGAFGLPVFHAFKGGISHLFNTTGGYIFGFIPMIYLISSLKDKSHNFLYRFGVCLLGNIALYTAGISYLSLFIGLNSAVQLGFLPFLVKMIFSISFAILSVNLIHKLKIQRKFI